MEEEKHIHKKICKSREICKELLKERGYEITYETNDHVEELDRIKNMDLIATKEGNILWVFITQTPLNVQLIKKYVEILSHEEIKHAIIIYESVTIQAKKVAIPPQTINIELFSMDEMQFNITKHELVPQHIKLSLEEVNKLRNDLKCSHENLKIPTILTTDPAARFYGYTEGDYIKIIRNGGYVAYRIVKTP
jgi:DNA-directed RNA polymerase I, II, and III subunit RPABC1